ncbi:expressed unknown protein [Seminavis robusta]|uniref:Uncharacterized protein n=1 Tax=Seminavis robusta TaxID=568900 RepID=A0A9N8DHZ5_9STRA|nr:expressed unknown protein [Seminavis robusta]|eukprot:Sro162_g072920.1 n/a (349) ;mRNA; f:70991-72037
MAATRSRRSSTTSAPSNETTPKKSKKQMLEEAREKARLAMSPQTSGTGTPKRAAKSIASPEAKKKSSTKPVARQSSKKKEPVVTTVERETDEKPTIVRPEPKQSTATEESFGMDGMELEDKMAPVYEKIPGLLMSIKKSGDPTDIEDLLAVVYEDLLAAAAQSQNRRNNSFGPKAAPEITNYIGETSSTVLAVAQLYNNHAKIQARAIECLVQLLKCSPSAEDSITKFGGQIVKGGSRFLRRLTDQSFATNPFLLGRTTPPVWTRFVKKDMGGIAFLVEIMKQWCDCKSVLIDCIRLLRRLAVVQQAHNAMDAAGAVECVLAATKHPDEEVKAEGQEFMKTYYGVESS